MGIESRVENQGQWLIPEKLDQVKIFKLSES